MAVTFILGRAGAGKTRYCLDALAAELTRDDETRRLLFIVPEQAGFQMERALATHTRRGGYWRADVLSFSRLAQRAFNELGLDPPLLRASARRLALRSVLESTPREARAFGAAAETPGFLAQLDRLLEELLREAVSPRELLNGVERLEEPDALRRGQALGRIYSAYMGWLGPERLDPAQRLEALRQRLGELSWLAEASVWVDGFAGFTGQELETLTALARHARDLSITLLLDPAAPAVDDVEHPTDLLNLFHRTEETYQKLTRRLRDAGVPVSPSILLQPSPAPRFQLAPALADLEAGLATPVGATSVLRRSATNIYPQQPTAAVRVEVRETPAAPAVRILEFETHLDEIRAAARHIRKSVRASNGSLRFRDFALIVRDLRPFADTIADVFAEFGLPHFIDRRRSLGSHVLARFARALLETVTADFSKAATTRLLRCRLLPLERGQAETLENLVLENEIHGLELWRRPAWEYEWQPDLTAEELTALHAARARIVRNLEPLVILATANPPPTGAAWAKTLYQTLVVLETPARLEAWIADARRAGDPETAETHRLAWEALCELFEDLHDVLGAQPLDAAAAAGLLASGLDELSVGLAPPTLDQVLVSSIERSRHPDIKHAWLMAFNDGIFPARPGEDVLLNSAERAGLALAGLAAPRPRTEDIYNERMLAYIALTRPSLGLTISHARTSVAGDSLGPSPILSEVLAALPDARVESRVERDDVPECPTEFARGYLSARGAGDARRGRLEVLRAELRRDPRLAPEIDRLLRGLRYRNAPPPIADYARRADSPAGVAWAGSPTELECYLQCPFKHFVSYALKLEPRRGVTDALELGRRAHDILANAVERVLRPGRSVRETPDDEWLRYLDESRAAYERKLSADFAQRQPRLAFMTDAQYAFLHEVMLAQADRWRRGEFEPLVCERPFRRHTPEALDALSLKTAEGRDVLIHGRLDRIDVCREGQREFLVIYDYKSSAPSLGGTYLTRERLQLMIYLLALEQAFRDLRGARFAGVFFIPLYPNAKMIARKSFADWSPAVARMHLYKPVGWFDAEIAPRLDRELGQEASPVAAMKLKKDGGFDRSKSRGVLNVAAIDERLRAAERTVLYAAGGLARGEIAVAPLLENKTLACQQCEFAAVCRFELMLNQPRRADVVLPTIAGETPDAEGGQA